MPDRAAPQPTPGFASTRALREFLQTEAAGGVLLVAAAVVGLLWANSPWDAAYDALWSAGSGLHIGAWEPSLDLRGWVNEGLMAIFFLVVGLEVKRELLLGELRERRRAVLPIVAAIGGMVLPALIYVALNPSPPEVDGWGIPMATDIAFAVGVLALVAPGIPPALRLFILTLAIVDDIGAIVVIALVYSSGIEPAWVATALVVVLVVMLLNRLGVTRAPVFVLLGVLLWVAIYESGVHPTIAGVAMGLLTPVSRLEALEHRLHGWSSLLIVPLFALANAGVRLSASAVDDAATSTITIGVVVGLVLGKTLGIAGATWGAVRFGVADLPRGATWRQLAGVAALGGIGFTVSLLIASLAYDDAALIDQAKIGVLVASVVAMLLATVLLRTTRRAVEA